MVSALDLLHLAKTAATGAVYLPGVERPADPGGWGLKGSRDFGTEVDRTAGNPAMHDWLLETLNHNQ
jgi:hypothetical protein